MKPWDYLKEYNNHRTDMLRIIDAVFKSGDLILGPSVKEFEENFAQYLNVKFAIGVNSGTDALLIALKTLGIGYGDEVITVANTAVPTISAIVTAGATPRFVDIDPETYLMNPDLIESTITDNTKCILPVDLYGQCANITSIKSIANRYGKILASNYTQNLSDLDLVLPLEAEGNEHSYHLYVVRHPQRDKIIHQLGEKNINLKINYPHPILLMPAYNHLGYKVGDLPVTEKISKEIFSLPMYPTMSEQEQNIICKSLREVIFRD